MSLNKKFVDDIEAGRTPAPDISGIRPGGFPSPARDYMKEAPDLNRILTPNRPAAFFARASNDNMMRRGIFKGDLLIIDKSATPRKGDIVLVWIDDTYALRIHPCGINPWGVVVFNVHYQRPTT